MGVIGPGGVFRLAISRKSAFRFSSSRAVSLQPAEILSFWDAGQANPECHLL